MKSASVPDTTGFDPVHLVAEHQAGVWRYLRTLGCDPALAEDLTQETFLSVFQRPFQDYNRAATASYLRRTAHNLLVSLRRRTGKVTAVEDVELLDQSWCRWAEEDNGEAALAALRECLENLSERARRALQMRFQQRESRAKIAADLDITEHGAKNLMQRAKQKLRACIESKLQ